MIFDVESEEKSEIEEHYKDSWPRKMDNANINQQ